MSPMNNRLLVPQKLPLLLDYAPGAAAAFSLRSLSNSYVGPVVTVRRSTDSAERDFTATEVSDGTLAAWCGGGDGFVKTWHDQSLNNRDATQTTTAAQPKIVDSGVVVTEGGKPAVQFDGVDDRLSITSPPAVGTAANGAILFVVVLRLTNLSVGRYAFHATDGIGTGSANTDYGLFFSTSGTNIFGTGASSDAGAWLSFGDTAFAQKIIAGTLNAAGATTGTKTATINGAVQASSTYSVKSAAAVLATIGSATNASSPFVGTMSELVLYTSDMTALRTRIEGDLAWYY